MSNYYSRQTIGNSDGSPLFATDIDKSNEFELINIIEKKWNCNIKQFGKLCPIDFYAIRDGRLVGLLELKSRTHNSSDYPTVFLNVRKWIALGMGQNGLGCPAIFIARFTDCIKYIPFDKIDPRKLSIGGTKKIVKSHTDIEPIIEIPVQDMNLLQD